MRCLRADASAREQTASVYGLAFTRYAFASRLLCTNQSSFYCPPPPAFPTRLQYDCNTIAHYSTPLRSPVFMPCTIQYCAWQYRVKAKPRAPALTSKNWAAGGTGHDCALPLLLGLSSRRSTGSCATRRAMLVISQLLPQPTLCIVFLVLDR